jgi:Ca2+-binding RTX toxin-like protein
MHCTNGRRFGFRPCLEALEARLAPAFSALFDPAAHVLSITGTAFPEIGHIGRDLAGNILLDNNPTGATVSNTDTILINSGGSQDFIQIDMANGLFGPGFTPEASGQSEIEINIDNGGMADDLFIYGQNVADNISAGTTGGNILVNLNGDGDADIVNNGVAGLGLFGQDGNDILSGAGSSVVGDPVPVGLWGGGGNDITLGGEGIFNSHFGGPGDDIMVGGKTIDRYFFVGGNLGSDIIRDLADGNNDTLIFSDTDGSLGANFIGPVTVNLSLTTPQVVNPGNLTLTLVNFGVDHVIGSIYDDFIIANNQFQSILLGGHDLTGASGNDVLIGQGGNDWLYGENGDDRLLGNGGSDHLFGGAGHDRLSGGAGDDIMFGEAGVDLLFGDGGNDEMYGGADRDFLYGGFGNDFLNGGDPGAPEDGALDIVFGGPGADTFEWALFDVFDFNPADPDAWA